MPATQDARMQEGRELLATRDELKARLPELRETLGQENYGLHAIEGCLAELDDELEALQSVTVTSIVQSLVGRRERSIKRKQEEMDELCLEREKSHQAIAHLEQKISDIEALLPQMKDLDATYATLSRAREDAIVSNGGERGHALRKLTTRLDTAKAQHHRLERTVQSCKHFMDRLGSMGRTLNRAWNKQISMQNRGVIFNVASRQIAQGSVKRAENGFERLCREVEELHLDSDNRLDDQIMVVGVNIAAVAAGMEGASAHHMVFDGSAGHPQINAVQELMGLLKAKTKDVQALIDSLDRERDALIQDV